MNLSKLILSMFQHGFKARYTTAYFVLIGKKTSSVLTYMQCYGLRGYYGLLPQLDREQYDSLIDHFVQQQWLERHSFWVKLTAQGRQQVAEDRSAVFDELDGWLYHKAIQSLWPTFIFTNQVISEWSHHEKCYRPIESNVLLQRQLKQRLYHLRSEQHWVKDYAVELLRFLDTLPAQQAQILSEQLVGHQESGQTMEQLARQMELTVLDIHIQTQLGMQRLIQAVRSGKYPLLAHFYPLPPLLSKPAQFVFQLVQSNILSIETIRQHLHKRPGTIMDYLIEIALTYPTQFPFDYYIGQWEPQLEEKALSEPNIGAWSYKEMEAAIPFEAFRFYQLKKGLEQ